MADETQDLSINDMLRELSTDAPASDPAPPPEPPAEVENPATPEPQKTSDTPAQDETQPAPGADTAKETQEPKGDEKPKFAPKDNLPKGVQKVIDKAKWEQHEAERKAEAAEREAEELRQRLEAIQAPAKPASEEPPKPEEKPSPTKPAFQFDEPKPQAPNKDDFELIDDLLVANQKYAEELAEWSAKKAVAESNFQAAERAKQATAQRAFQQAHEVWTKRVDEVAKTNPVIQEAIKEVGPFLTSAGQQALIMKSEVGPDILLYLKEHPDETMAMARMGHPTPIAYALGRIEQKILASKQAPNPKPETPPDEELTPPPKVAGGQTAAPKAVDLNDPELSTADWQSEVKRQLEAASQ